MIDWVLYSKIRRYKADGISMRRTAEALGISRKTVKRYWEGGHTPDDQKGYPAIVVSPEKQAVMEALIEYFEENKNAPRKQAPNAKTAWEALRGRFSFGESTIRRFVHELRGRRPEAFIPLDFEAGEVMQVDWCEIKAVIDGYMHTVPVFCAALPYSYAIFVAVMHDMTLPSLVEAHMAAFDWFSGITERVFYDYTEEMIIPRICLKAAWLPLPAKKVRNNLLQGIQLFHDIGILPYHIPIQVSAVSRLHRFAHHFPCDKSVKA